MTSQLSPSATECRCGQDARDRGGWPHERRPTCPPLQPIPSTRPEWGPVLIDPAMTWMVDLEIAA